MRLDKVDNQLHYVFYKSVVSSGQRTSGEKKFPVYPGFVFKFKPLLKKKKKKIYSNVEYRQDIVSCLLPLEDKNI